ncbi:MAG: DnaJ domain-containing protein [Thalassolituus sp.]
MILESDDLGPADGWNDIENPTEEQIDEQITKILSKREYDVSFSLGNKEGALHFRKSGYVNDAPTLEYHDYIQDEKFFMSSPLDFPSALKSKKTYHRWGSDKPYHDISGGFFSDDATNVNPIVWLSIEDISMKFLANIEKVVHVFVSYRKNTAYWHGFFEFCKDGLIEKYGIEYTAGLPWWEVLGVSKNISDDDLKKRYRVMLSKYHPDKTEHLGEELRALALKKTKEIMKAYEQATE